MLADPLEAAARRLDTKTPAMPVAVTRATLNLSSEGTVEIREVASDPANWIEVVTTDGDLLVTLNDQDCSNLIVALTNVWRARVATNLNALKETA